MVGSRCAPGIAVVVAAYNRDQYLRNCLDSVLLQDIDCSVHVVDDASTDDTRNIITSYVERCDAVTATYHDQNRGVFPTQRRGIHETDEPLIKVLDADDALPHSDILRRQRNILAERSEVGYVTGQANYMDAKGRMYKTKGYDEDVDDTTMLRDLCLGKTGVLHHGANLVRRSLYHRFDKALDFSLSVKTMLDDHYRIKYMDEPVLNYRTHQDNVTNNPCFRASQFSKKASLANDIHESSVAAWIQQGYWAALDAMKILYSRFRSRR